MQIRYSIRRYLLLLAITCSAPAMAQEHFSVSLADTMRADTLVINQLLRTGTELTWSDPDSARRLFHLALDKSIREHDSRGTASSLLSLGNIYGNTGEHEAALKYYRQALDLALRIDPYNSRFIQMLQNNIALTYTYLGFYQEAAEYYYSGIAATNIPLVKGALCINLAITLRALGEYPKALYYIGEAQRLAVRNKEAASMLPYVYLNKSEILLSAGKADEALQTGLQAAHMIGDTAVMSLVHEVNELLGKIYTRKKMMKEALQHHRKGLEISREYPLGEMRSSLSLGSVFLDGRQYDSAGHYLQVALETALKLKMREELTTIYNRLADLYYATHRYMPAFASLKQATKLRDSSVNIEKMRFINLMDIKYQTAEKNKELAEKKLLITQQHAYLTQKNMWIAGILTAAGMAVISFWLFYRHKQRLQEHREEITAWRAMAEGEEKERTRIARELHDSIGGALSTVKMYFATIQKRDQALADTEDYREAMRLLENTLTEVRNTAHNLMPELLLRHGLSEAVRIFCRNITTTGELNIDFQYYGFIDRFNNKLELAVYRIIQELVQNIRKHAFASKALVQLSRHNQVLSVTVEDNGIGMETGNAWHNGLGLQSIQNRITDLKGTLSIRSAKEKGTTIYFEINFLNI